MADGDPVRIQIDPPPPPRAARVLSFALGIGAGVAGFLGYCEAAAVLALLSVGFNLADYFMNRGTVEIPRAALDEDGRVKGWKRPDPTRPGPNQPPRP